MYFLQ
jgi:hypothetical protein